MPTTNIKLFDENKVNIMADEAYQADQQRIQGVQSGIASSQLYNKVTYQASLVAYAIAQLMVQNGLDANDSDAVSTFVNNLSSTMLQKVNDIASTDEAKAGVANNKWMSPALVKEAINVLAAKVHVSMNSPTTQDNVSAGYSIGTMWLRPSFELQNHSYNTTAESFIATACTVVKNGQIFTVAGNGDDKVISASNTLASNNGWLYAVITTDATAISAKIVAGDVEQKLNVGVRNVVALAYVGTNFFIEATYSTANAASSGTITINNLTVLDKTQTRNSGVDANGDISTEEVLLQCNNEAPFDTLTLATKLWQHSHNGVWDMIYGLDPVVVNLYELLPSASLTDVLCKLRMPLNTYGFHVTVMFDDNTVAAGLPLFGLLGLDGATAVTDRNGKCFAYASTKDVTVNLNNIYGVVGATHNITALDNVVFTEVSITAVKDTSMHLITTSGDVNVCSGGVVDLCAVGGGGAGGGNWSGRKIGAGGGGYAVNLLGHNPTSTKLTLVIGAGGTNTGSMGSSENAADGGTTSVKENGKTIVTANGGKGGQLRDVGGAGNGNGRGGEGPGLDGSVRVFNDPSLPLPGGGGGKGNYAGGKDFGGAGTNSNGSGNPGKVPGGGGGATLASSFSMANMNGGAGGVYLRVRYV